MNFHPNGHGHYRQICTGCRTTMAQCRCRAPNKSTTFGVCLACKTRLVDVYSWLEWWVEADATRDYSLSLDMKTKKHVVVLMTLRNAEEGEWIHDIVAQGDSIADALGNAREKLNASRNGSDNPRAA